MFAKRGFFEFGVAMTALAAVALCVGQVIAQGAGDAGGSGSGSGAAGSGAGSSSGNSGERGSTGTSDTTSGTSGAIGSGNVSTGQTSASNQTGSTGPASTGATQSTSPQGANNLLLDRPGLQQPPAGTQGQGVRPFDGQSTPGTNQRSQINQNPAGVTVGGRDRMATDRSLLNGPSVETQQRDALQTIHFRPETTERGIAIETLGPGSIFFDSGLRPGDEIVALGGQPVRSSADFERFVLSSWGQRLPATIWRGGQEQTVDVVLRQVVSNDLRQSQLRPYQANRPISPPNGGRPFLGVGFDTSRSGIASVRDVVRGSAAEQAGLREGDIIVSLNGQPVSSYQEAIRLIGSMQAGDVLEIEFDAPHGKSRKRRSVDDRRRDRARWARRHLTSRGSIADHHLSNTSSHNNKRNRRRWIKVKLYRRRVCPSTRVRVCPMTRRDIQTA